jgi:multidrug efflux system membrane fusion protein
MTDLARSLRAVLPALAVLVFASTACKKVITPPPPPAPPSVDVALSEQRAVTNYLYFTGRTEAFASAEIRARVPGFLKSIEFRQAQDVEAGEVLFHIDPEEYEARQAQRAAALSAAQANLSRTQSDYDRVARAVETNAVSRQEVETRKADRDMAQAEVAQAEANLKQAELDLSYCTLTSPIAGQISRNLVDVGNLVGSGENTLLATVEQMDTIFVYFEASEDDVLRWLEQRQSSLKKREADVPAYLGLSNNHDYPFEGVIDYIDNRVNPNTGTILLRAAFPNPEGLLFPGLFARIRVPGQDVPDAVLVEEKAIGTDLGGKYVLAVGEDNIVELKHVELGALEGKQRVILSGLEPGQRYIVEGLMRARPGRPCSPSEVAGAQSTSEDSAPGAAQQG